MEGGRHHDTLIGAGTPARPDPERDHGGAAIVGQTPGLTIRERAVNGRPGLTVEQDAVTVTIFAFDIAEARITRIWIARNPDKLRHWARDQDHGLDTFARDAGRRPRPALACEIFELRAFMGI